MEKRKKVKVRYDRVLILFGLILIVIFGGYFGFRALFTPPEVDFISSLEEKEKNELFDSMNFHARILEMITHYDEYPSILWGMLERNIDSLDYMLGYLENKGKVFAQDIGHSTVGEYPLLLQYDTRWGYGIYGDSAIAINGCGPASVAIVVAGLTGRSDVTPYTVSEHSYKSGYYYGGTSWNLFTEGVKEYGIQGQVLPLVKNKMIQELEAGHPIICSMRPGDFTTTGHIIVLSGVEDGKFVVKDPNSRRRSSQLWDFETLQPQIKQLWSFQKM